MTLSQLAKEIATHVLIEDGLIKRSGTRVYIEVGDKVENLLWWWLDRRYPIQPLGADVLMLFQREMSTLGKLDNARAIICALDCGCRGTERSLLFRRILFRQLGR